jgi:hypothetical protein
MLLLRREWVLAMNLHGCTGYCLRSNLRRSVFQRVYFNASLMLARRAINRMHTKGVGASFSTGLQCALHTVSLGALQVFLDSFQSLIGVPEASVTTVL